ncbi:copper-binding protein [Ramlibacter sp. H39-3-26]|uniref:copper-binding protein n=1 Tax=Curvibacter soli TaxID=3031331 RepID=UPI0023DAAA08|nr:copper-binding protein [Ramlibacter sp. H39-3-26]MDF1485141.1 copper-binding protein [Ramlibacter sp. H39-3-26]
MKILFHAVAALLATAALAPCAASAQSDHAAMHNAAEAAPAAALTDGEVRGIDAATGRITLRHGDIANLGMPAMTMVFRATDAALLQGLRVGDQVRFAADRQGGQLVVTQIRKAAP